MRYIDTLRGLAALLVVWLHGVGAFSRIGEATLGYRGWLYSVPNAIDVGHIGVVVFFLISGFVIPFSIRADEPAPATSFLIKRFFRLFPAYWLSVPCAFFVVYGLWGTQYDRRDVLINLTLLQNLFGVRVAEGVYWTLPVEIVFYLICVVLLRLHSLFAPRRIAALAALLLAIFAALLPTYGHGRALIAEDSGFWFLNLSLMLWGTLYRARLDAVADLRGRIGALLLWGLAFAYVAVVPLVALFSSAYMRKTLLTYTVGLAIFVVGTRVLRIQTRLTDWLGRISYSIYLFHVIVFTAFEWWLLRQPADSPWRMHGPFFYLGIGVAGLLALASLIYACIERPGIRLGHWLAARLAPRAG